eukprot:11462405-Ditylum_brightwellii.AAC.1
MKIDHKSLKFASRNQENKHLPIPFYVFHNKKKLSLLDYQTYKLQTNPKDEKSAVIKGQDTQDRDAAYLLVKSLLKGDALQ